MRYYIITKGKGNQYYSHVVRGYKKAKKDALNFAAEVKRNTWLVSEKEIPNRIKNVKHLDKIALQKFTILKRKGSKLYNRTGKYWGKARNAKTIR